MTSLVCLAPMGQDHCQYLLLSGCEGTSGGLLGANSPQLDPQTQLASLCWLPKEMAEPQLHLPLPIRRANLPKLWEQQLLQDVDWSACTHWLIICSDAGPLRMLRRKALLAEQSRP